MYHVTLSIMEQRDYKLLSLFLNICRHDLDFNNFDSIYKKYIQHFPTTVT